MLLYIITDCDAAAADRVGRQMSRVRLNAVLYSSSERGKATADEILRYQTDAPRSELLDSLDIHDREKAAAFMGAPLEALLGMKRVALVIPADSFGRYLGPKLMHLSDKAMDDGVQFAEKEGTISLFPVKMEEQIDTAGYFINSSVHLKVSDLESIKDLPLSEQ
ncbi:MAG: hypothetical protein IKV54_02620 [Clostridia bacterium]|nr:hypothetical protein [Clostridia bacterium]